MQNIKSTIVLFTFLQICLMSSLIEDDWILMSVSVFHTFLKNQML